ncbi:MAG: GDSL-type esterase/lipase family protein [Janthinobacterium lividum]
MTRRRGLLLAALAAGCAPVPATEAGAVSPAGLSAFHAALAALQAGRRNQVAVLQIGDSHTANDGFSSRLREMMQARFGDAGRGLIPPGIPFKYYRPSRIAVTAEGWALRSAYDGAAGPYGLALLRQQALGPASMTIRADEAGGLTHVAVDALGQPGGGTLDLVFDSGERFAVSTGGNGPVWRQAPAAAAAQSLTVTARGDGPVDLLGFELRSGRPGVTWSNLGTIGATMGITAQWSPALVASEIRALDPSLVLLAFGTNEGFKDSTDPEEYRTLYRERLRAVRAMVPRASVLVVLPPDGARRLAAGSTTEPCPPRPGDQANYAAPPRLAMVRRTQQQLAAASGLPSWDWSAAMGGTCSILPLSRTDPPQAAPDLVHLFRPGYRATAELLFAELMRGYPG